MTKDTICGAWLSSYRETCELPVGHEGYHEITGTLETGGEYVTKWTGDAREERVMFWEYTISAREFSGKRVV